MYKRQEQSHREQSPYRFIRPWAVAQGNARETLQNNGLGTVSYTHLDVYKRQVLEHFSSPLPAGKNAKKALLLFMDGGRAEALPLFADYGLGVMTAAKDGGLYLTYRCV